MFTGYEKTVADFGKNESRNPPCFFFIFFTKQDALLIKGIYHFFKSETTGKTIPYNLVCKYKY